MASSNGEVLGELKELSRNFLLLVAPDPVLALLSKLLYSQAKKQRAKTAIPLLFYSIPALLRIAYTWPSRPGGWCAVVLVLAVGLLLWASGTGKSRQRYYWN